MGTYGYTRLTREQAVRALARAFSQQLEATIGREKLAEAARLNRGGDPAVCHSHDYCDANMAMDAAYEEVLGDSYLDFGPREQGLWDEAWDLAKDNAFFTSTED